MFGDQADHALFQRFEYHSAVQTIHDGRLVTQTSLNSVNSEPKQSDHSQGEPTSDRSFSSEHIPLPKHGNDVLDGQTSTRDNSQVNLVESARPTEDDDDIGPDARSLPYDISDECLLLAVVAFYWGAWYPVRVNINGLDLIVDVDVPNQATGGQDRSSSVSCTGQCAKKTIRPLIGVLLCLGDIGTDVFLAVSYNRKGETNLFWITLVIVLFSTFVIMLIDVSLVIKDRKEKEQKPSLHLTTCRCIASFLSFGVLGRIWRTFGYWWHSIKSADQTLSDVDRIWHKKQGKDRLKDSDMLIYVKAFSESGPQFAVQLYITYAYNKEYTIWRVFTLATSLLSITWGYMAYYRSNRAAYWAEHSLCVKNKDEPGFRKKAARCSAFIIYFLSVMFCLGARFICTVFFVVHFDDHKLIYVFVAIVSVHILGVFIWIAFVLNPRIEGTVIKTAARYLYFLFCAYVSLLLYVNVVSEKKRETQKYMTRFYGIVYFENLILLIIIWSFDETFFKYAIIVFICAILHVLLLIAYYAVFHPTLGLQVFRDINSEIPLRPSTITCPRGV